MASRFFPCLANPSSNTFEVLLPKIDTIVDEADLAKTVSEWAIPALKGKINLNPEIMDKYAAQFYGLYKELPRQVIHRDPNPSNNILAKDRWGFIDFDKSVCFHCLF